MTSLSGSLIAFMQSAWTLSSPVGTADIEWTEGWWNSRVPDKPQITVTELAHPKYFVSATGGSLTFKYKPMFLVNVWQQIPRGADGTLEVNRVDTLRFEVARLFRTWFSGTASASYGGSLSVFGPVLPLDAGVRRHELDAEPRMLRYEITLFSTRNSE